MKFTIKHNGAEYPVTVIGCKGKPLKFDLIQIHSYGERPRRVELCWCTQSIQCRLKHYKDMKKWIFGSYSNRFKQLA